MSIFYPTLGHHFAKELNLFPTERGGREGGVFFILFSQDIPQICMTTSGEIGGILDPIYLPGPKKSGDCKNASVLWGYISNSFHS